MIAFAALALSLAAPPPLQEDKPLSRIAFGCCSTQERPLPIFDAIVARKPELYLALGDNIYADTEEMKVMAAKYDIMKHLPGYAKLRDTCPMLATWDDHDYGKNDAGVEYPRKKEAQQLFLDFFDIPANSPRRTQEGVYNASIVGPVGKRVQFIFMDLRYFRSPLKRGKRAPGMTYTPYIGNTDADATMLGEVQWKWLAEQLKQPAEIRFLISSVQLLAEDHGFEKWQNFPNERSKLFDLIRASKANGLIVLSGDRHLAELSCMEDAIDYPLYDLTSSGLNMASKVWRPVEVNRHRVATMPYGDNFGMIHIDWETKEKDPLITLEVRDDQGEIAIRHKIPLSILQPGAVKKPIAIESDQPKPSQGAISAADAMNMVDEEVTLEMRVNSGRDVKGRIFLNSEKNYKSDKNFTIVVNAAAMTGVYEKATASTFTNKIIRVKGKVSKFKDSPQIIVDDAAKLEIIPMKE